MALVAIACTAILPCGLDSASQDCDCCLVCFFVNGGSMFFTTGFLELALLQPCSQE